MIGGTDSGPGNGRAPRTEKNMSSVTLGSPADLSFSAIFGTMDLGAAQKVQIAPVEALGDIKT